MDLFILIFLYTIILSSIPFIVFNFYKVLEIHLLKEQPENDNEFLNIFNELKNQIIPNSGNVNLYKNWRVLTLFCACEYKDEEIIIHMNNLLKKDKILYRSILAHELFHANDKIYKTQYLSDLDKELACDTRAAFIVGKENYLKTIKWLSKKWFTWDGESYPKWAERIKNIQQL